MIFEGGGKWRLHGTTLVNYFIEKYLLVVQGFATSFNRHRLAGLHLITSRE